MARTKNKRLYLTKRILMSAAKSGVKIASRETMDVMGYVIEAKNGWVIKKFPNGVIQKISPLKSIKDSEIALD